MTRFTEKQSFHLEKPVSVVIGCGDMGMSAARVLGQHHPVFVVDIDGERAEMAAQSLRTEGYGAKAHCCDITDAADTEALGEVLARGPGVKVLAHVAGVGADVADWRKVMAVDLVGPHRIAEAIGPAMVRGGVAIFVASIAQFLMKRDKRIEAALDAPLVPTFFDLLVDALGGEPTAQESYNYAKFGVVRLAARLALRWGEREVRALSLSPGMIDSSMGRASGGMLPSADGKSIVERSERAREIPLLRQGTILEITQVLGFLASDLASYINGTDIIVDGGLCANWLDRGSVTR